MFLTLVAVPGAANVLMSHHVRPVPHTHVRHGPPVEQTLILVTAPGAANPDAQKSHNDKHMFKQINTSKLKKTICL